MEIEIFFALVVVAILLLILLQRSSAHSKRLNKIESDMKTGLRQSVKLSRIAYNKARSLQLMLEDEENDRNENSGPHPAN